MKQKTQKMLSLFLAVLMVLGMAVPALASEAEPPEKELRWVHLDWDENGCSASTDALKSDNPGEGNGTGYDPSRQDAVLFFIWNNKTNKREGYVVPKAGDGLVVEKLPKEAIASGAKQSSYYVTLRMTEFRDSELTASGLSFHVNAMLGDFGFYSAETPSAEAILVNEAEAAALSGDALYFCAPYMGTEEAADHDAVTKVEKDHGEGDDNAKFYDIEQVKDGVWKLTINDAGKTALKQWGGAAVNLKLEVKQPDGNTREDGRNIFIKGEEQKPSLWVAYPDWNEDGSVTCSLENLHNGTITSWPDGSQYGIVIGTCDVNENGPDTKTFQPIAPSELTASEGLTLNTDVGYKQGDKYGKYYITAEVDAWDQDYTITYGEYSIKVSSKPTDVDIYKTPEALAANKAGIWGAAFNPTHRDEPYYVISTCTDAEQGRHLTDAKLTADWEDNKLVELEKESDSVYKVTIKKDADLEREAFLVKVDLTWTDFLGNTWTEGSDLEFKSVDGSSIVASETALGDEIMAYKDVADKVSSSVTMTTGESKTIYLYYNPYVTWWADRDPAWYVYALAAHDRYHTNSDSLTLTEDPDDYSKFTLSADKPGTYEIVTGFERWDYENLKLFHADGKAYTDAEMQKFHEEVGYTMGEDGELYVVQDDGLELFTKVYPGETYEIKNLGWTEGKGLRLTVTVEAPAKSFVDVKESDWFYNEVNWAVRRGIAAGTGTDTFSPLDDCTHAHILTFLWRAAGEPESEAKLPFTAKNSWAADALVWAYEKGMIDGALEENAKCTSADAVMYIWQAKGKPGAEYDGRFTDVAADAAYAQAVAWALDAGVTNGNGVGTFGPGTVCSRGRIVTFLYRAFK